MSESAASAWDELTLEETRRWLTDRAFKRFGKIPPETIADHVIAVTHGADFPVRRAAIEALERRMASVQSEKLSVSEAPRDGIGRFVLVRLSGVSPRGRSGRREHRPYETVLESIAPVRGECTCPDYLKGSLGLCKHLLAAMEYLFTKPKRLDWAKRASGRDVQPGDARLTWDPIIPLVGSGDRLRGLRLHGASGPLRDLGFSKNGQIPARILDDPARRYAFLASLSAALGPKGTTQGAGPGTRALIADELAHAERTAAAAEEARLAMRHLTGLQRHLYPYQSEGVRRFLERGRLLLADDMGLGKTTQAIAACHALFHAGLVKRGLIVTPASLKPQWLREWNATTDVPATLVDGSARERLELYRQTKTGFLIVNYEIILRDFEALLPFASDMVVLDEAQRIKNYATKSAAYVKMLPAKRRLVLTGTPLENRFEELASILDWVDDRALAPKWRLGAWHLSHESTGDETSRGPTGARNLDTLRLRLAPCLIRRIRADVIDQLPSRTDTRVPVAMTTEQLEEHEALTQPIVSLMHVTSKRPLTQAEFLKLMQLLTTQRIIANGLAQLRFDELWPALEHGEPSRAVLDGLFAPKLDELRRLIEALVLQQNRKVVIFSQWRRMLRLANWSIGDLLSAGGRRSVFFTGAESQRQRAQSIVDFHDDPRASVLFLSDAGGVGLNLQHAANACINLELPWNPAVLEQRIGRIYRLGQKRPIDVYNLVSEPSIESRIATLVATKQALFKGLFDGTTNEVRFETASGFMADVKRIIETVEPPTEPETPMESAEAPIEEDLAALDASASGEREAALGDSLTGEPTSAIPPREQRADDRSAPDAARDDGRKAASNNGPNVQAPIEPAHQTAAPLREMSETLRALKVTTLPDGGLRIEAPPEAATTLATLFETMAKVMRSAATSSP